MSACSYYAVLDGAIETSRSSPSRPSMHRVFPGVLKPPLLKQDVDGWHHLFPASHPPPTYGGVSTMFWFFFPFHFLISSPIRTILFTLFSLPVPPPAHPHHTSHHISLLAYTHLTPLPMDWENHTLLRFFSPSLLDSFGAFAKPYFRVLCTCTSSPSFRLCCVTKKNGVTNRNACEIVCHCIGIAPRCKGDGTTSGCTRQEQAVMKLRLLDMTGCFVRSE